MDDKKQTRLDVANRIKMQMIVSNYGLPENAGYDHISTDDARRMFLGVRELWVRLDLYVATGQSSKGAIDFPEAKRRIEYNLIAAKPEKTTVIFKALVKERRR